MSGSNAVNIVELDDPTHLDYIERSMAYEKKYVKNAIRDPLAADLRAAFEALEELTLKLLAEAFGVSVGKVMRIERERLSPHFGSYIFHELDCILEMSDDCIMFCEIKHSIMPVVALRNARKQLRKRLRAGEIIWPKSYGVALGFQLDSTECPQLNYPALEYVSFDELADVLKADREAGSISTYAVHEASLREALDVAGFDAKIVDDVHRMQKIYDAPMEQVSGHGGSISNSIGDAFKQFEGDDLMKE